MSIRIVHGADAVRRELIARHGELAVVDEAARRRASAVFGESLSPREFVARVVERVQTDGDAALREIAAKVGDHIPSRFEVSPAELAEARAQAPPDLAADLEIAADRIRAFHQRQRPADFLDETSGVGQRWTPVDRAGIHIPGASGPLASSVLMTAIPARVAGVREIVVCTAAAEAGIDPVIALARTWPRSIGCFSSPARRPSPPWPSARRRCRVATRSSPLATPGWCWRRARYSASPA